MEKDKLNKFSVPLGLLDYMNPVFYTVTMVIIMINLYSSMGIPYYIVLSIGAVISIVFGLVIPTGKVLVGLGVIRFKMPVSMVFIVNFGIFLSGLMLLKYAVSFPLYVLFIIAGAIVLLLLVLYLISKKVNTTAVLTGAFGYLMIYVSLIILSAGKGIVFPIICYSFAILLFVMLCGIGIRANLKNPKVHWVIEISNVACQFLVALGTLLLFL